MNMHLNLRSTIRTIPQVSQVQQVQQVPQVQQVQQVSQIRLGLGKKRNCASLYVQGNKTCNTCGSKRK